MTEQFFERPILNSPYVYPGRHWELDKDRQPTNRIIEARRRSDLITPVPTTKKRRQNQKQGSFVLGGADELSTAKQEYNPTPIINEIRTHIESWRNLPSSDQWLVTPAIGDFTPFIERGEHRPQARWRRERNWDPTVSRRILNDFAAFRSFTSKRRIESADTGSLAVDEQFSVFFLERTRW